MRAAHLAVPSAPRRKQQVRDHVSPGALFQPRWTCLCFLPGHTSRGHTLQCGRSLGRGHTRRTRRPGPPTFPPGTARSRCVSSSRLETRTPHSTARDAEPFSDPEEAGRWGEGRRGALGTAGRHLSGGQGDTRRYTLPPHSSQGRPLHLSPPSWKQVFHTFV